MAINVSSVSQISGGVNSLMVCECLFAGAAPGANGVVLSPVAGLGIAADKVFLSVGGSSAASSALMTAAVASAMVAIPTLNDTNETVIGALAGLQTAKSNMATGLVNYFASAVAVADSAKAVNFCVAGIPGRTVVGVELKLMKAAAAGASTVASQNQELINYSAPVVVPEPVTLGANSRMIKTGSTQVALGTDLLVHVASEGLVYGTLTVGTAANLTIGTGDVLSLKIKVLV